MNNLDVNTRCNDCKQYHKFPDINLFCEWLLQQTNSIVIAHNLRGYDGIFKYHELRYVKLNYYKFYCIRSFKFLIQFDSNI
jgi:hypothetical protein